MAYPDSVSVAYRRAGAGAEVVEVQGEVDVATAPHLDQGLSDLIDHQGNLSVVIDLREVAFMDAAGLAVLAKARQRIQAKDGALALADPPRHVRRVLEVTGMAGAFDTCGINRSSANDDD